MFSKPKKTNQTSKNYLPQNRKAWIRSKIYYFAVKNPEIIIDQVKDAISQWRSLALNCEIPKQLITDIQKTFNKLNKPNICRVLAYYPE